MLLLSMTQWYWKMTSFRNGCDFHAKHAANDKFSNTIENGGHRIAHAMQMSSFRSLPEIVTGSAEGWKLESRFYLLLIPCRTVFRRQNPWQNAKEILSSRRPCIEENVGDEKFTALTNLQCTIKIFQKRPMKWGQRILLC